jgi:hypothetical protein
MAYDHPAYISRLSHNFGANAAGASTAFSKFVAFTAMTVFAITAADAVTGSSTYTFWNGTATVTGIAADAFTVRHVINGTAVSTRTFGTFAVAPYNGTATGTQTATAGVVCRYELSNGTSTATTGVIQAGAPGNSNGGFNIAAGDTIDILRGTDATAVTVFNMEYAILPLANVSA